MFESESKAIIAMKGHPFTRKTEFAKYIATALECAVLSLDDFLDFLSPDYCQTPPSSNTSTPPPTTQPQDLAFETICRIAMSNLSRGCVQYIVIDSPLSSRSHLDQLIEVASSTEQTRLFIVECKSDNSYLWQTTFEEYLEEHPADDKTPNKWYKANKWEDVENAIRNGYDERSDGYQVSKLVFDPLSFPEDTQYHLSFFIDAVHYMIMNNPDLLVYDLWRRGNYFPSSGGVDSIEAADKTGSCRAGSGHYITNYSEALGVGYDDKCTACDSRLDMDAAAYTCSQCSFALHKECAELLDNVISKQPSGAAPPYDFNRLLGGDQVYQKVYPELIFRCSSSCDGKDGLDPEFECGDCFFTTHLKSRLLPTVIRHDCHRHFLSVEMAELNPWGQGSNCNGCGFFIIEPLWYSCKICGVAYHTECLTQMPVRVEHEHGGHHHEMLIQYTSQEAEDYICDVCFENEEPEKRDPNCWFYSCQDCEYVAHLTCLADEWIDSTNVIDDPTSKSN